MAHREFPNIFFDNPYLNLSLTERLIVKAVSAAIYSILTVIAALFILDSNPRREYLAILLILFVGDVILQRLHGERRLGGPIIEELSRGRRMNIAPFFRASTTEVMEKALAAAEIEHKPSIALFIVRTLSESPEIEEGLVRLGIDRKAFIKELQGKISSLDHRLEKMGATEAHSTLQQELKTLGHFAFAEAVYFGESNISPTALFLGVLHLQSDALEDIFARFNFSEPDFHNAVIAGRLIRGLGKKMLRRRAAAGRRKLPHRIMNRAWTARPTPLLDQFSDDLTDRARSNIVGFMVGHEDEYRTLVNILARDQKNNALLVGVAGIGKDTIIEHLAFQITRDEIPSKLFDKRLVKLSLASLMAGVKTTGELQARLEAVIDEILAAGNIVLYLPDIHLLKTTAQEGGHSAFEAFKPVLQGSLIPVIGTTDPKEYRTMIETDPEFNSLFDKIDVGELSKEDALRLLTYESYILEAKERVTITYKALRRTVELAHRFIRSKPLPASAVGLLQEAIAETKTRKEKVLTETIIAEIVTRRTKIPIERAETEEAEKLLKLEERMHERLINQNEAVKAVASAMRQYRAGLARERGPIATFLFVGPTGVGKTELAKTLAALYFGGEEEMIRFDMSEYKDPKSIWNLIGSPDGTLHGNLIEAVKSKPYAVLLLDEFEKAHGDILELFLPLFDEGRLTSSLGEVVDFSHTIIIATSNAHSNLIKEEVEKGTAFAEIAATLKQRLTEYFKPELINRFDGIVVFRQLTEEEIDKIAGLNLQKLVDRLEREQGIVVNVADGVTRLLAKLGWDPVFGARPLRGVIASHIREPLAQQILKREIKRGDTVRVAERNGDIIIEKIR